MLSAGCMRRAAYRNGYGVKIGCGDPLHFGRCVPLARVLDDRLIYEILSAVEEIPRGRVATYSQIARLIGREKNARLVGKVLSMAEFYGDYPCHRVVNSAGRCAPGWREQRGLLEDEGVEFTSSGKVRMKKFAWDA